MFEWNDKFNTGIATIDEQHQELFRIAAKILDLLRDQYSYDKYDKIIQVIYELKAYTVYHFKSEEEHMQKIGYKRFFSQKVQHDDFIKKLEEIDLEKVDEDQDKYITEILEFVSRWIIHHILEEDKLIDS